jgi:hypothetical protein
MILVTVLQKRGSTMIQPEARYREKVLEEVERIPVEYLPFLLNMMQAFRESVTLRTAEESFRQGWQEALQGETRPVAELWDDLDYHRV